MTCAKQCIPTIQICSCSRMLEWKGNCLRTQTIFRNLFDREFASLPFYAQHKKLLLNGSLAVIYCWVVNKQPKITINFAIFFLPNDVNFFAFSCIYQKITSKKVRNPAIYIKFSHRQNEMRILCPLQGRKCNNFGPWETTWLFDIFVRLFLTELQIYRDFLCTIVFYIFYYFLPLSFWRVFYLKRKVIFFIISLHFLCRINIRHPPWSFLLVWKHNLKERS